MGAKKDEYRFTIQFSSTDPRHLQVADILNHQGRRKAQYLVNAVLCYESKAGDAPLEQPLPLNYQTIEAIVNQILKGKTIQKNQSIKLPSIQSKGATRQSEEITLEDAALEFGQDGFSAIADSIAAFRKKY